MKLPKPGEPTPKTPTPRRERHFITLAPDVAAEVREVAARHGLTPKRLVKLLLAEAHTRKELSATPRPNKPSPRRIKSP